MMGFVLMITTLSIQAYTIPLLKFENSDMEWQIFSFVVNTYVLIWIVRKEMVSIEVAINNQYLLFKKYIFFIKISSEKIYLPEIRRIWVGEKKIIIKRENEKIELNKKMLNRHELKKLLLIQRRQRS